jgi:hypothetical protein
MSEPITLTAYAARRGVSVKAVSKAVAAGRLSGSVVRDKHGSPKIADPELADREWVTKTRASIDRKPASYSEASPTPPHAWVAGLAGSGEPPEPHRPPEPPPPAPRARPAPPRPAPAATPADEVPDYHAARARREAAAARREAALADIAELDAAERKGELVPVDEARSDVINRFTIVRTRILSVPSRFAQRAPDLAAVAVPILDELLRDALEELADPGENAQDGER